MPQTTWNKVDDAAAKSIQSCPTLCDPIDGSPAGSPVPGILQARPLEWVAVSFCNVWKWKVKVKSLSRAQLLATPWTAAYQAPPFMGFSRQEHWSGVSLTSPKWMMLTPKCNSVTTPPIRRRSHTTRLPSPSLPSLKIFLWKPSVSFFLLNINCLDSLLGQWTQVWFGNSLIFLLSPC